MLFYELLMNSDIIILLCRFIHFRTINKTFSISIITSAEVLNNSSNFLQSWNVYSRMFIIICCCHSVCNMYCYTKSLCLNEKYQLFYHSHYCISLISLHLIGKSWITKFSSSLKCANIYWVLHLITCNFLGHLSCNFIKFGNISWDFLKDIQSSSLDAGCLLFCSLSRWSHPVSVMSRFWLRGGQSMTDTAPFFFIYPDMFCTIGRVFGIIAEKWSHCQSDTFQMVDQNLTVIFSLHNCSNFDKLSNTTN